MLTEVDLKRKNKYSAPCLRHHHNSKKIPGISEIKLSLPYSKVVPKYFIRSHDFFFFFFLLFYFLLFLCRLSSTLTPSPSPPGLLPLPAHCLPPPTQPAPPAHLPTSPPLSPRSWELLAPPSKERPLSGPVQDRTEQGGVLQHWPPEHLVDRGGRK